MLKKGILNNHVKDKRYKGGISNGGRIATLLINNSVDHKKNVPLQTLSTKHACCMREVVDIY
jgi:hypothetical protein